MKYRPTLQFLGFVAAMALLASPFVFAQTAPVLHEVNVSWVNATQATDGTTLPLEGPNALRDTRVRYGTCNAARDAIATHINLVTVPVLTNRLLVSGLADGVYCFQAQHSTNGAAADAVLPADGVSNWTLVVSKELKPLLKKPNRPQNVVLN